MEPRPDASGSLGRPHQPAPDLSQPHHQQHSRLESQPAPAHPGHCRAPAPANLVAVELIDNAGGVPHPEELFRPFQPGAHATGLGLYLSRAFARSFGGDLQYSPVPGHASFTVTLPIASNPEETP